MLYNYDKRIDELNRISNIQNVEVKTLSLQDFIKAERLILLALPVPPASSQALNSARRMLDYLENSPAVENAAIAQPQF